MIQLWFDQRNKSKETELCLFVFNASRIFHTHTHIHTTSSSSSSSSSPEKIVSPAQACCRSLSSRNSRELEWPLHTNSGLSSLAAPATETSRNNMFTGRKKSLLTPQNIEEKTCTEAKTSVV
jgi:hypothetical protein